MSLYCLFEIYAQHQRLIKSLFGSARKFCDVESIHNLRVEIKRLRALFNLIEWINPSFQARSELKELRKLFKAAGVIRDNHVQQELTAAWMKKRRFELSEYLNNLKFEEKEIRGGFSKACAGFNTRVFTEKWQNIRTSLAALPAEQVAIKAQERLRFMIDKLVSFRLKSDFLEEDFHQIRILSKETRYTLEIIRKCFSRGPSMQNIDDGIRKMHQALGKWHDDDMGLQFLDTFLLDYEGEALYRRNDYFKLIQSLEGEKKRLLSDFEKAWTAFLKLAAEHHLVDEDSPDEQKTDSIGDNDD